MLAGVVPGADRTDFWPPDQVPETFLLLEQAIFGADEVPQVGLLSAGRSEQLQGFRIVAGLLLISAAVWHTKAFALFTSDPGFLVIPLTLLFWVLAQMCYERLMQ